MTKRIESVQLPLAVALQIVTQGIRIRLGRSLVTLSGVLLGIMFFSSVLTTHLIKAGVADEDEVRTEVNRMANFLEAELGHVQNGRIAIISMGELNEPESRLGRIISRRGGEVVGGLTLADFERDTPSHNIDFLVIMGTESTGLNFESLEPQPIALTRLSREQLPELSGYRLVSLSRALTPGEEARRLADERTAKYRLIWIVTIALIVTLMGITNAMLMSVTERFREIGTMKCLGATRRLVRRIFLLESLIIGSGGGVGGALFGALFSILFHGLVYGFPLVIVSMNYLALGAFLLLSAVSGIILTVIAAIYPAGIASRMLPSDALRSNV